MGTELSAVIGSAYLSGFVPPADPGPFGGQQSFDAAFNGVGVIIGIFVVVGIVLAVRNASVDVRRGIAPTTVDAQMKARLLQSSLLDASDDAPAPLARTIDERLGELDRLPAGGTISEAEHAAARAEALRSL